MVDVLTVLGLLTFACRQTHWSLLELSGCARDACTGDLERFTLTCGLPNGFIERQRGCRRLLRERACRCKRHDREQQRGERACTRAASRPVIEYALQI